MLPVNLFDLASQQARWLSVRQSTIAGNIANVNTPGYRAVEVEPFEKVLSATRVAVETTDARHISTGATTGSFSVRQQDSDVAVMPSENSVVLENELMKDGEVGRTFELNTAIVKAFHRMILMSTKG
jgi:flagellar basal-body rod protein FlgB